MSRSSSRISDLVKTSSSSKRQLVTPRTSGPSIGNWIGNSPTHRFQGYFPNNSEKHSTPSKYLEEVQNQSDDGAWESGTNDDDEDEDFSDDSDTETDMAIKSSISNILVKRDDSAYGTRGSGDFRAITSEDESDTESESSCSPKLDSSVPVASNLIFTIENPFRDKLPRPEIKYSLQYSSGKSLAFWTNKAPNQIFIYDRFGKLSKTILTKKGNCNEFSWSPDGIYLAVVSDGSTKIHLWNSATDCDQLIDSKLSDGGGCLSWCWNENTKILAYTTHKGNLFFFDFTTRIFSRDIGVSHCQITCAAWSNDGVMVLANSDNELSFHKGENKTVPKVNLSGIAYNLKFGLIRENHSANASNVEIENAVTASVNLDTLYLIQLNKDLTTYEIPFEENYGSIQAYEWRSHDAILVSLSAGYLIAISTKVGEIGVPLNIIKLTSSIVCSSFGNLTSKVVVCFEERFEIRDGLFGEKVIGGETFDSSCVPLNCSLNDNGELLAVLTKCADLVVYLVGVPFVGNFRNNTLIHLISLDKISIQQFSLNSELKIEKELKLTISPSIIAVGPRHFCAVMDKCVYIYSIADIIQGKIEEFGVCHELQSHISEIQLNKTHTACRCGDVVFLRKIIAGNDENEDNLKFFPKENSDVGLSRVTSFTLTKKFFIYGGNDGIIRAYQFDNESEREILRMSPIVSITRIIPNRSETFFVIIDEFNKGYILDLMEDKLIEIPGFPNHCDGVLWESDENSKHIFITYALESSTVNAFVCWHAPGSEIKVYNVREFKAFDISDVLPLCLMDSLIYSLTSFGSLVKSRSISEDQSQNLDSSSSALRQFDMLISLKKYSAAIKFCLECGLTEFWDKLGKDALISLDLDSAVEAFLREGNVGLAIYLDSLLIIEDLELFLGHISVVFKKFMRAEKHFLRCSEKWEAVHMRINLQQWDDAFRLAKEHSPELLCLVSKEFALSEECRGNYLYTISLFDQAIKRAKDDDIDTISECKAGLARNCFRAGQIERGLELVQKFTDSEQIIKCADALVTVKSAKAIAEAAELYVSCKEWDKAASLYIQERNWEKFKACEPKIKSQDVFRQFAQAKELDGNFKEAGVAFENIGDHPNACRLYLKANEPTEAIRLAKSSEDPETAKTMCNYFLERKDIDTVLRFLLKTNRLDQAAFIALSYDCPELYTSTMFSIFPDIPPERVILEHGRSLELLISYCNETNQFMQAAQFSLLNGNPVSAFECLMNAARFTDVPCQLEFLDLMVEVANSGHCKKNPNVKAIMNDYYSGKLDGKPKDPRIVLMFAIGTEDWNEAARASLVLSKNERETGNYLAAHCTLLYVIMELKFRNFGIPSENMEAFGILQSYLLSRTYTQRGIIETAARLLARLAQNLDKFPIHVIEILTHATIYCTRAGLKETGMQACLKLMLPENRPRVGQKYKEKFEKMARRYGKKSDMKDEPDEVSPCPFCGAMVENFELNCKACSTHIPFCIATGRHVTIEDLSCCPSCKFPAIRTEFAKYLQYDDYSVCPMCESNLSTRDLYLVQNPETYLLQFLPHDRQKELNALHKLDLCRSYPEIEEVRFVPVLESQSRVSNLEFDDTSDNKWENVISSTSPPDSARFEDNYGFFEH